MGRVVVEQNLNRNVYKDVYDDSLDMIPSDPMGSLDESFFVGGVVYG